jgi:ZIP family zinc transporter
VILSCRLKTSYLYFAVIGIYLYLVRWRKTDLQMGLFLDEVALSTFLVVRFTLHNRSEGLAIVTPIAKTEAKKRTMIRRFVIIGWIAGIPTIAETWIGGFLYSPIAAAILLSVGAGAKFK